jgi:hypothetical protein
MIEINNGTGEFSSGTEPISEEPSEEVQENHLNFPKKLADEILPTAQYIAKKPYDNFITHRSGDPIAILLNPSRMKTEREEQKIDALVEQKISAGEATNSDEAMQILYQEHLYAPQEVLQYLYLVESLRQIADGTRIENRRPLDLAFLKKQLQSRREHEDGVAKGIEPHWRNPQPPTKQERKRAEAERKKMDRFLTALGEPARQEERQTRPERPTRPERVVNPPERVIIPTPATRTEPIIPAPPVNPPTAPIRTEPAKIEPEIPAPTVRRHEENPQPAEKQKEASVKRSIWDFLPGARERQEERQERIDIINHELDAKGFMHTGNSDIIKLCKSLGLREELQEDKSIKFFRE